MDALSYGGNTFTGLVFVQKYYWTHFQYWIFSFQEVEKEFRIAISQEDSLRLETVSYFEKLIKRKWTRSEKLVGMSDAAHLL